MEEVEDEGKEHLSFFKKNVAFDMKHNFLNYRPIIGNDNMARGGVARTNRHDCWTDKILTSFKQREGAAFI